MKVLQESQATRENHSELPDATGYDGDGGTGGGAGGGNGSGISYDLSGRTSKSIPRPSNVFTDEGKVVVTIWVNREW
jgi:hypothetical protein